MKFVKGIAVDDLKEVCSDEMWGCDNCPFYDSDSCLEVLNEVACEILEDEGEDKNV